LTGRSFFTGGGVASAGVQYALQGAVPLPQLVHPGFQRLALIPCAGLRGRLGRDRRRIVGIGFGPPRIDRPIRAVADDVLVETCLLPRFCPARVPELPPRVEMPLQDAMSGVLHRRVRDPGVTVFTTGPLP
jgi:hypothetical protein